jgi:hypothetical protein
MRFFGPAAVALLAACGSVEPELSNQQMADAIENVATAREAPEVKGPAAPTLTELSREEVEGTLPGGGACDFSQGGRLLFVSVAQGSLAKVGGQPVHAVPNGPTGPTGGFWASERFAISVGRLVESEEAAQEMTSWPARLVLTDRQQEENNVLRLEGSWSCGA